MSQKKEKKEEDDRLPTGLLCAMSQNMHSIEVYARLNAGERADLLDRAAHAETAAQMRQVVEDMIQKEEFQI